MKTGVILINLGTPDNCSTPNVRRYLKEFLLDPRVIDLPALIRYLLVYGAILPFRPAKSAKAYKEIWKDGESPLRTYSHQLCDAVQNQLGDNYQVALGMRYGNPSIEHAINQVLPCDKIIALPLFPQYSSAATGSAIEKFLEIIGKKWHIPSIDIIHEFYQSSAFINSYASIINEHMHNKESFLLLSYHGLPTRHIPKTGCKETCQGKQACPAIGPTNFSCYRAQCYETSRRLADALSLPHQQFMTSFQSRLGKTPWIEPYTEPTLHELYQKGIRDITIACPAFTADCLETIEEIGMQAKEIWEQLGGTSFTLIPCLNNHPLWVKGLADIIKKKTNKA